MDILTSLPGQVDLSNALRQDLLSRSTLIPYQIRSPCSRATRGHVTDTASVPCLCNCGIRDRDWPIASRAMARRARARDCGRHQRPGVQDVARGTNQRRPWKCRRFKGRLPFPGLSCPSLFQTGTSSHALFPPSLLCAVPTLRPVHHHINPNGLHCSLLSLCSRLLLGTILPSLSPLFLAAAGESGRGGGWG